MICFINLMQMCLMGDTLPVTHFWPNATLRKPEDHDESQRLQGCFYSGKVEGEPDSTIRVSLCGGMVRVDSLADLLLEQLSHGIRCVTAVNIDVLGNLLGSLALGGAGRKRTAGEADLIALLDVLGLMLHGAFLLGVLLLFEEDDELESSDSSDSEDDDSEEDEADRSKSL
uniref:Uncharacterized protein n=1 Tax=Anopheles farauti TaxID=69004 RepID=A0A182QGX3_9DIPT